VENERIIAQAGVHERLFDGAQPVQIQALLPFELVGAMGIADGHGQGVHAALADELHRLLGVGVNAAFGVNAPLLALVVLSADQLAQFAFHHAIVLVGVFDDPFADFDVFVKRLVAAVNHHAGEPFVNALLAKFERVAVVEVHGDGDVGSAHGRLRHEL
jgi:hypothetical protein